MRFQGRLIVNALVVGACILGIPVAGRADKLELRDGTQIEGIILKVESGQVSVSVGSEQKQFSILDVTSMNFDTPHVPQGVAPLSMEHFAASSEIQEIAKHIQAVDKAAIDLRQSLDQIKKQWGGRKTISASETSTWDGTKDQFGRALSRYQEVLGDFYVHILNRVDQYDRLTKEAGAVRLGVQGAFNVGSALVSKDQQESPLKKFVPAPWYDTIFYRGYSVGYTEGYYGARPREFVAPQ